MATDASFVHRTRSYQQEMFDQSMRRNIIVVMDTGSGKTQVALLRIQAELDRCSQEQRVWFLAPSVQLCTQQHEVLQRAMPAYRMQILTGQDNVDKWSEPKVWEAALDQARVVVSTHAVLCDALRHGFVQLASLALLVFDEAHHCTRKHPANVIMRDFYHKGKAAGTIVPHILGLSASLITSSQLSSVTTIEANLDAVSVTPRIERSELMRYVFRPDIRILRYDAVDDVSRVSSESLDILRLGVTQHTFTRATIAEPNVQRSSREENVAQTIQNFYKKVEHIFIELGASAADFFIRKTIASLRQKSSLLPCVQLDVSDHSVDVLLGLFDAMGLEDACQRDQACFPRISAKVQCLLDYLLEETSHGLCGIVFVEQRAVASVLSSMLNDGHLTHGKIQSVPTVGTSSFTGRKFAITELLDREIQQQALPAFRKGEANIVVATSVLEEGIDVQACNVVACFDVPANLKSYIQRRGRARHPHSRYGMLLERSADQSKIERWHKLEHELTQICQKEREQAERYARIEADDESPDYTLSVPSTGAMLDVDSTLQHLHRFCQMLQRDPDVDPRPIFSYTEDGDLIRSNVTLPHTVPLLVRYASSKEAWRTEKAAKKDAAFHAYSALYDAGLLNDHLLPLSQEWDINKGLGEATPPNRLHLEPLSCWRPSGDKDEWCRLHINVVLSPASRPFREQTVSLILNAGRLVRPTDLSLYWDKHLHFVAQFGSLEVDQKPSPRDLDVMHTFTAAVYRAPRTQKHWPIINELATFIQPTEDEAWQHDNTAACAARHFVGRQIETLIRIDGSPRPPYLFSGWTEQDEILCTSLPKRRDFSIVVQPGNRTESMTESYESEGPVQRIDKFCVDRCTVEMVPVRWARIGLFMPAILQHVADFNRAESLIADILPDIGLFDLESVRTALTTPSAQRSSNYQRFEFLGDCVLKFAVSCHLHDHHPNWPEGYLSQRRALLVCNATLTSAALRTGLHRYIISEHVDYRHWTLPSPTDPPTQTEVSSKVLADVVEALIGVAWRSAGMHVALRCINIFIPTVPAEMPPLSTSSTPENLVGKREQVEGLIDYKFSNPRLLQQALTHPSYASTTRTDSYERLEFLGDAVLDVLIADILAPHMDRLTQGRMTQIKAALVNADLLGFLCFQLRSTITNRAVTYKPEDANPVERTECRECSLADYLYFHPNIGLQHQDARARHGDLQQSIQRELDHATCHPWAMLKRLNASKMFSDMVESVLGAIFLDSNFELVACHSFLKRLGLEQYANRVISEQVDVVCRQAEDGE